VHLQKGVLWWQFLYSWLQQAIREIVKVRGSLFNNYYKGVLITIQVYKFRLLYKGIKEDKKCYNYLKGLGSRGARARRGTLNITN
jgi:hypothetical protein